MISDNVLDNGLAYIVALASPVFHVCSAEPADFAAVAGASLGTKSDVGISAIQDAAGGGREVEIEVFSDGAVSSAGDMTHWALVQGTELVATGEMTNRAIAVGDFAIDAPIAIRIPDAV